MATGGSDETFEFICTPCSKDSKHVEAVVYCVECKECFCQTCYNFHQRFSAMVVHKVLDKTGMQTSGTASMAPLPTETCETHSGKLIVVYCEDHDALCCVECVSSVHRSCPAAVYIPQASVGFKDSAQLKDLTDSIKDLADEVDALKMSRQREIQMTQRDKNAILNEIQTVKDNLIQRIKELGQISVDIVKNKYDPLENALEAEIKKLDEMKTDIQSVMTSLTSSDMGEAQLYIFKKRGISQTQTLRQKLQDNVPQDQVREKFHFVKKPEINKILDDVNKVGSMVNEDKIYTAKLHGEYSMKMAYDKHVCNIVGPCLLSDGTVVVTDWNNKRLKHLDTSYRVTDHCDMPSVPWGIACTAPDEVAVTMTSLKKVQFVSVGDCMCLARSFSTSGKGRGICYCNGELFVSCGGVTKKGYGEGPGHVAVYRLNGTHIRTIQTDPSGQQIFSLPYHITASPDGTRIYVAQGVGGVVSLDRKGTFACSFTDPSMKHDMGVCALDNGHILVCGRDSNNVLQFDSDGRKLTELLKDTDGIKSPYSLCYDSANARLIVTMRETDNIKVFDLV